ncbi:MAG TPA: S8 family serine peptidase [Candidatus Limnocylindria bacterium]
MRDRSRTAPLTRLRPAAGLIALVLVTSQAALPEPITAARPAHPTAADWLVQQHGGRAGNYRLVYQRQAHLADGSVVWAGKLIDRRSGTMHLVYRDAAWQFSGAGMPTGRLRATAAIQDALERKADRPLRDAVAHEMAANRQVGAAAARRTLPVAVWLSADPAAALADVREAHPDVRWIADRPLVNDLVAMRRLRAELWRARRGAYAEAAARLRNQVEALGGSLAYASTAAPLVFVDLPADAVASLAERPEVTSLGLEGRWEPAMSVARSAVDADWTSGSGDRGNGVRVAVVEYHNVRRGGDMSGTVVKSHSTSGALAYTGGSTFDHPTWVAGAIAGQSSGYRGVAPGADVVSAGTGGYRASLTYDRRIIAAADWAVSPRGGNADIINTSLVQDTATGAEEARRYFDSIVDQDGRLAISAAGNYVNFGGWQIGSPGTGYNVLTVGGVNDRGTPRSSDDRLWYAPGSNGSNWLDRPGDPWNSHGDYNKPNLVAPAVNVRTANGLAASGTSVATPIVAGVAAQLLANQPVLAAWPEGARAVLMAGAIHRVPMPDGSRNVDHEGVGMASAYWTNLIAHQGDAKFGGYTIGAVQAGEELRQHISVRRGDRLRVALAWNSHTSGGSNLSKSDVLRADLDLRVTLPDGSDGGSYTIDNAYEFVEIKVPLSGVATIEVLQSRFDGSSETFGLAWAKVRDSKPPKIVSRSPAGQLRTARVTPVRVTFNEMVRGVSGSTFRLRHVRSGERVDATVTYSDTTRTARLAPDRPYRPGWYVVRLTDGITDRAGNRLASSSWGFRVRLP